MTRSPILKDMLQEMQTDPWHIKARRWCKMRLWRWSCRTRFVWDLYYKGNIFKRKDKQTKHK